MKSVCRRSPIPGIIIAVVLFALEILTGAGLLGGVGIIVVPVALIVYVLDREAFSELQVVAFVFTVLLFATLAWGTFNFRVAQRRAVPIIIACDDFHAKYKRYPTSLDELVPGSLRSTPRANYIVLGGRYRYVANPPALCFSATFFGVVTYYFRTHHWWAID